MYVTDTETSATLFIVHKVEIKGNLKKFHAATNL